MWIAIESGETPGIVILAQTPLSTPDMLRDQDDGERPSQQQHNHVVICLPVIDDATRTQPLDGDIGDTTAADVCVVPCTRRTGWPWGAPFVVLRHRTASWSACRGSVSVGPDAYGAAVELGADSAIAAAATAIASPKRSRSFRTSGPCLSFLNRGTSVADRHTCVDRV